MSLETNVRLIESFIRANGWDGTSIGDDLHALIIDWRKRGEALEQHTDKIEGLECDIEAALDVLWRRGDDEARVWIGLNYRKFASARTKLRSAE